MIAPSTRPDVATRLRNLLRVGVHLRARPFDRGRAARSSSPCRRAQHSSVAPILNRVTKRRLTFLTNLYIELGFLRPLRVTEVCSPTPRSSVTRSSPTPRPACCPWSGIPAHVNQVAETLMRLGD